ncbi:MAG: hypothetical protein IPO04_16425 [Cytophagaceae bacterium]|nr:hypothetical protein [Cytophagaceae bacterium]
MKAIIIDDELDCVKLLSLQLKMLLPSDRSLGRMHPKFRKFKKIKN